MSESVSPQHRVVPLDSVLPGDESQEHLNPPVKPKAYYVVFGTFIFLTMVVGSVLFLSFLSTRKD